MNRLRFFIVVLIIFFTGFFLQVFKIVNFATLFRLNVNPNELVEDDRLSTAVQLPETYDIIHIIVSAKDREKTRIPHHLSIVLTKAHIQHAFIDIETPEGIAAIMSIPQASDIIIATEELDSLDPQATQRIRDLVNNGSHLTILLRSYNNRFFGIAGIQRSRGFLKDVLSGLKMTEPIFPGLDEIDIPPEIVSSSSLDLDVSDTVKVIATAEDGTPLIWTNASGKGSVLYTNSTLFQYKLNRGLLLQTILYHRDFSVAAIYATSLFHIDDFPAPIKQGNAEIIFRDYQRNNEKFYREIWWPDMRELAALYDQKFTGFVIGNYGRDTKLPFLDLKSRNIETIETFGRRLSEISGEIGIHGFNHNPLVIENEIDFEVYGYSPWPSLEDMVASLTQLRSELVTVFGEIPFRSYVAPSNLVGSLTKQAVLTAFPNIKVFCGIYTAGKVEGSKGVFLQEFGQDPDYTDIYDLPRLSSGYIKDADSMWAIYNGIAEMGLFAHFIHPDDITDPDRANGLSWELLRRDLESILSDVSDRFPFMEPMTTYEAYLKFLVQDEMSVYTRHGESVLEIFYSKAHLPVRSYLRLQDQVIRVRGGNITPLGRDGLYILEATAPTVVIQLR